MKLRNFFTKVVKPTHHDPGDKKSWKEFKNTVRSADSITDLPVDKRLTSKYLRESYILTFPNKISASDLLTLSNGEISCLDNTLYSYPDKNISAYREWIGIVAFTVMFSGALYHSSDIGPQNSKDFSIDTSYSLITDNPTILLKDKEGDCSVYTKSSEPETDAGYSFNMTDVPTAWEVINSEIDLHSVKIENLLAAQDAKDLLFKDISSNKDITVRAYGSINHSPYKVEIASSISDPFRNADGVTTRRIIIDSEDMETYTSDQAHALLASCQTVNDNYIGLEEEGVTPYTKKIVSNHSTDSQDSAIFLGSIALSALIAFGAASRIRSNSRSKIEEYKEEIGLDQEIDKRYEASETPYNKVGWLSLVKC